MLLVECMRDSKNTNDSLRKETVTKNFTEMDIFFPSIINNFTAARKSFLKIYAAVIKKEIKTRGEWVNNKTENIVRCFVINGDVD